MCHAYADVTDMDLTNARIKLALLAGSRDDGVKWRGPLTGMDLFIEAGLSQTDNNL